MKFLLVLFLFELSLGATASLSYAPRQELKDSFFYVISMIFGAVLLSGAALAQPDAGGIPQDRWYPLLMGAGAFALVHFLSLQFEKRALEGLARAAMLFGGLAGTTFLAATLFEVQGTLGFASIFLATLSSTALLGSTASGMLCGHWYLINRKLDFWVLRRFTKVLCGAVLLKLLSIGLGVWLGANGKPETLTLMKEVGSPLNLLLGVRVLVGGLLPLGMTYMIWDCVKRESNQSATGLLYVQLSLVMAGEALAFGLAAATGGAYL